MKFLGLHRIREFPTQLQHRSVPNRCDYSVTQNPQRSIVARSQVEGNIIQGVSRALYEEVTYDANGVTSLDWGTYPILRFPDVPELEIVLINRPEMQPLGAGEGATIPPAAAIANAIFDAVGVRLREGPFTPKRVLAAMQKKA